MKTMHTLILSIVAIVLVTADMQAGRWLSRDPIVEGSGFVQRDPMPEYDFAPTAQNEVNLYAIVGNDPVMRIDYLGLKWKVFRRGDWKATAYCGCGDTVEELANVIGLDRRDFLKWLASADGNALPHSFDESINEPRKFNIPNTVFAYWAGEAGWVGKGFVSWNYSVRYLKQLGFNVQEGLHNRKVQNLALQELILEPASQAKQLHGLYFWGHGRLPYPSPGLSYNGVWIIKYSTIRLSYKMALGLVFACDSNNGRTSLMSPERAAIWNGYNQDLDPFDQGPFNVNQWIKPGDQGTHVFSPWP